MKYIKLILTILISSLLIAACHSQQNQKMEENPEKTLIVDVRTPEEWIEDGHADCTVNYPLDILDTKLDSLREYNKIIVVCRSGNRSNQAKESLEKAGFKNVENMGAWQNITCK